MPHVSEVRSTSHDRHDPMLVAALAAGDLAGTDRDQAMALTESCSTCADLHADLVAIARATAALPPPIAAPGRDFRLSPEQAASLRPGGWRRFVPLGGLRGATTGRLGVGLATIGLAGLLIGNVPLGFGGAASAPSAADTNAAAAPAPPASAAAAAQGGSSAESVNLAASAAASSAPVAPAASAAAASSVPAAAASPSQRAAYEGGVGAASSGTPRTAATEDTLGGDSKSGGARDVPLQSVPGAESRPWNAIFIGAIVLGLALLIASRRRGSASA